MSDLAQELLQNRYKNLTPQQRIHCARENIISQDRLGLLPVWETTEDSGGSYQSVARLGNTNKLQRLLIQEVAAVPVDHASKSTELLLALASNMGQVRAYSPFKIKSRDLAIADIPDEDEAVQILLHLRNLGFLQFEIKIMQPTGEVGGGLKSVPIRITASGWEHVSSLNQGINSNEVFIAIKFGWEGWDDAVKAIQAACKHHDFNANIVEQAHVDYINDKIISGLNRARFVVADFTFNNRGVYFEAGYARGLGRLVFHTVQKGHTHDKNDPEKRIHFDIHDINYIEWETPADLQEKLTDRIGAVLKARRTSQ